ncbi:uncharacterized protein A1O9_08646 [Exophiala aquamarina CBS 119918]|uniref:AMP-dependent synthetase/ligase domain-containing protein n=1 Tax=Exophiala aquamarina CBS 119918 TaxID=1182545 RepID=A0A072P4G6_9EURO|nr:uncharacterized protein A1O9_08646 [Exophiala aquamarina CBS 119918]KEF54994.1 hypothetical protein A1O9_08646 [Exophiala aquamarina CBS 119918]
MSLNRSLQGRAKLVAEIGVQVNEDSDQGWPPRHCCDTFTAHNRCPQHPQSCVVELRYRHSGSLGTQEEVYIALLGPGDYEYIAAFLVIVAAGAIVVPIYHALPVSEALYYTKKVGAVAVLYSASCLKKGEELGENLNATGNLTFQAINIRPLVLQELVPKDNLVISSTEYLDPNLLGLVIFTSGTTGPLKAAVIRRAYLNEIPLELEDLRDFKKDDCILHLLSVHRVTGIGVNILPFLFVGASIEFQGGQFESRQTWERLRQGGVTVFSGVPTLYVRMM